MLTKRIIPCLDVSDGRVVKGLNFESLRDAGDPVELAKKYSDDGADELVFLDITASEQGRETLKDLVRNIAKVIDIPFTVGGGVGEVQHARDILLSGADKVGVINCLLEIFGKQCIVAAIDAKRNYSDSKCHNFYKAQNVFLFRNPYRCLSAISLQPPSKSFFGQATSMPVDFFP